MVAVILVGRSCVLMVDATAWLYHDTGTNSSAGGMNPEALVFVGALRIICFYQREDFLCQQFGFVLSHDQST